MHELFVIIVKSA